MVKLRNFKLLSLSYLIALLFIRPGEGYSDQARAMRELSSLPVQSHGRIMPLHSFAIEQILEVTGRQKVRGEQPLETVMNWMSGRGQTWELPLLEVNFLPLRREVGLDVGRRKFSLDELLGKSLIMRLGAQSAQIKEQKGKPTKVQGEAERLLGRMGSLYALTTGQTPRFIPLPSSHQGEWLSLSNREKWEGDSIAIGIASGVEGVLAAWKKGDWESVSRIAPELKRLILLRWSPTESERKRFNAEVLYNQLKPVALARTLYLLGLLALVTSLIGLSRVFMKLGTGLIGGGFVVHAGSLALRAYIGARAPWSNFYESLLTVAAMLVLVGLIMARKSKLRGLILGIVGLGGYLALLINDRSGLSPGVDTLVPALQSYWLNIHVIVLLTGYACATLAMLLGHAALVIEALQPQERSRFLAVTNAVYRSVQLAMLFIFAGTVLGGVWAHEAWGRYWGWDPKETWALITWFGYLGVAHARFAGWLSPRGVALAAIGVFPLVLMTYYGVNYLLSGLHSYAGGESASIPPLIIAFLIFETLVVIGGINRWHLKLIPTAKTP